MTAISNLSYRRPVKGKALSSNTVLFVTPHQDDETISMGIAVRDHLNAGLDVHILLLTTGENSGVRAELGMDIPTFVAARDDELFRAARQLGVRTANIHIDPTRGPDNLGDVAHAQAQIGGWLADHPGARVKSYTNMANFNQHVDHQAAGQACWNLWQAGTITDLRFYIEPWLLSAFKAANPTIAVGTEKVPDATTFVAACNQYAEGWQTADVAGGFYGIGFRSVATEFEASRSGQASYWHAPVA